jgi:hypothetical protein
VIVQLSGLPGGEISVTLEIEVHLPWWREQLDPIQEGCVAAVDRNSLFQRRGRAPDKSAEKH